MLRGAANIFDTLKESSTNNDDRDTSEGTWRAWSTSAVGIEMAMCIVLGLGFGYWLDGRFDTRPVLMLVFLGLGIVAGFRALVRGARGAWKATGSRPTSGENDNGTRSSTAN